MLETQTVHALLYSIFGGALVVLFQQALTRWLGKKDTFQADFQVLCNRVLILETESSFWREALKKAAIEALHRPHEGFELRDGLLDKYADGTLAPEEARALYDFCVGVLRGHEEYPRPGEVAAAMVLKAGLECDFRELGWLGRDLR